MSANLHMSPSLMGILLWLSKEPAITLAISTGSFDEPHRHDRSRGDLHFAHLLQSLLQLVLN
jgi:hypothetical protein